MLCEWELTGEGISQLLRCMLLYCRLDGRKYAVKKIKLQPSGGSSSYARILREVATLSRLQHPNIVRYFQVGGLVKGAVCPCTSAGYIRVRHWVLHMNGALPPLWHGNRQHNLRPLLLLNSGMVCNSPAAPRGWLLCSRPGLSRHQVKVKTSGASQMAGSGVTWGQVMRTAMKTPVTTPTTEGSKHSTASLKQSLPRQLKQYRQLHRAVSALGGHQEPLALAAAAVMMEMATPAVAAVAADTQAFLISLSFQYHPACLLLPPLSSRSLYLHTRSRNPTRY